jgi:hypothetical protein
MLSLLGLETTHWDDEPGGVCCPCFSVFPRPGTLKGGQQTDRFMERLALIVLTAFVSVSRGGEALPFRPAPVFLASPLVPGEIRAIVPLGNLNPRGGHVFPTDHIYLDYGGKPDLPVFAPAAGTVFAIRGQSGDDFKIEIRVDENLSYYLGHVFVGPEIRIGGRVKAAQVIGRASARAWLDLGAYDARVQLPGFANASRYSTSTRQTVPPLALFAEPLKGELYAKVVREGPDKDGKIDFD